MKKLLLVGAMLTWSFAAAAAENECPASASPVVQQTDVSTIQRNSADGSAVIQLDVTASLPGDGTPDYLFTSPDGSITSDGSRATWTVSGAGPFTADVQVSAPSGCRSHARFTYHMEQAASE